MKNRVKAWLYEAPAILLLIAGVVASIYVNATKSVVLQGGWWVSVIFIIILALFLVGKYFESKQDMPFG